MTTLYIANTTKQNHEFLYRVPGNVRVYQHVIPAGMQMKIYQDASQDDIQAIVDQHAPYGLVHVGQVKNIHSFIGCIYQLDKPIDAKFIHMAFEKNDDTLEETGHEIRKQAAVATNAMVDDQLGGAGGSLKNLSVEVIEQEKPGDSDKKKMKERINVQEK